MKHFLVYGGTFDPVHLGHQSVMSAAMKYFRPDRGFVVPAYQNPRKAAGPVASAAERIQMCRLVFGSLKNVTVSRYECDCNRPVATWETIVYLKKRFGKRNRYTFVCGTDAAANLSQWNRYERLVKECDFGVVGRAGFNVKENGADVVIVPMKQVRADSSDIRRRITEGGAFEQFLDPRISDFIRKKRLYEQTNRKACNV